MRNRSKREASKPDHDFPPHVTVTVSPPDVERGECYCRVEPSVARVRYGGTVTFRAAKGCGPLVLFLPPPRRAPSVFPALRAPLALVRAARPGRTFRVTRGCGVQDYPYAVYCREHNCFARGSLPRMMVGP